MNNCPSREITIKIVVSAPAKTSDTQIVQMLNKVIAMGEQATDLPIEIGKLKVLKEKTK